MIFFLFFFPPAKRQEVGALLPAAFKDELLACDSSLQCRVLSFPQGRSFASSRLGMEQGGLSSSCSALSPTLGAGSWPWGSQIPKYCDAWSRWPLALREPGLCVRWLFFSFMHYIQEEMDCAGTAPEAILSLPGSQMHGHIACLSLARLGELQQV